jgi:hypothetical protein
MPAGFARDFEQLYFGIFRNLHNVATDRFYRRGPHRGQGLEVAVVFSYAMLQTWIELELREVIPDLRQARRMRRCRALPPVGSCRRVLLLSCERRRYHRGLVKVTLRANTYNARHGSIPESDLVLENARFTA